MRLRAGRVFTARTDDEVLVDGVVTVEDGEIVEVAPYDADVHADVDLHAPDATLLPGLIDAHCHLTLSGYELDGEEGRSYEAMIADPDELMAVIAVRNLHTHLASGVTTLRDNGGRNRVTFVVREAVRRGYVTAPRMLLAGRPLTHTDGHFHWCNGVADGVEGVRAAVRTLVAEGADHIKVMASGGGTQGTPPQYASYTLAELRAAVETSHGLGRLTTAHCRARASMELALEAGMDCLEHAEFLDPAPGASAGRRVPTSGAHDAVATYDPRLVERMLEQGTFASVTLQQGGYDRLVELRARAEHETLPGAHRTWMRELEERYAAKVDLVARMLADGLREQLVISSDCGVRNTAFGRMDLGVELGVAAGLTSGQALAAVTRTAAQACGIADDVGTLEVGRRADLLLVHGDATSDVARLADVHTVFKDGVAVPRDTLAL